MTSHHIVAIDPGIHTGIAVFTESPTRRLRFKESYTIHTSELDEWLRLTKYSDAEVVVEQIPAPSALSPLGRELQDIVMKIRRRFPNAHPVYPGVWKPVTEKIALPVKFATTHESDAYRIGIFYHRWKVAQNEK